MNMKSGITAVNLEWGLSACTSSGVVPMGSDTFMISTTSELSHAHAKKIAHRDAVEHCSILGKEMMPVTTTSGSHRDAFGDNHATYDYTFRCLDPAAPGHRPAS